MQKLSMICQVPENLKQTVAREQIEKLMEQSIKAQIGRALEIPVEYETSPNDGQEYASTEVLYMTGDQYREMIKAIEANLTDVAKDTLRPFLSIKH